VSSGQCRRGARFRECTSDRGKEGEILGIAQKMWVWQSQAPAGISKVMEWPLRWLGVTCRVAHERSAAIAPTREIASRQHVRRTRVGNPITRFGSGSRRVCQLAESLRAEN